jgi:hypothetical protein
VIGATEPGTGEFVNRDRRLYYRYTVSVPGSEKALVLDAAGFDNESNSGCAGQINVFVLG